MGTFAALMTGKGTGAISTIEVFGDVAGAVVEKIFRPAGGETTPFRPGRILLGAVVDGDETIDQVVIGCEGTNAIAINCHGNPLIVELIMELLQKHGAELITAEQLLTKELVARGSLNTIAVEAKLAQVRSLTLEGTRIILNQIEGGLNQKAAQWLEQANAILIEQIRTEAAQILRDSQTAKLIIDGCTAAIVGPPNSGKSTLLNYLCGKQKALVTDIRGTTRDWISGRCQIGPLSVELIDTAGLEQELTESTGETIKKAAHQKTVEVLGRADLVLLVLDGGEPVNQFDETVLEKIADKKMLTVINKCDLPHRLEIDRLPPILKDGLRISAKFGTGIENLVQKIPEACGAAGFDSRSPICVSERQEDLLRQLQRAQSRQAAASIITELLNGPLPV